MKAFVFSIGEKTTDLCCDLMKEYGFEVILYQDSTSLWEKLKRFYIQALEMDDEWFFRVDADIIPYKVVEYLGNYQNKKWVCASGFDWYKQKAGAISIHKMHRDIIKECLNIIEEARLKNRPESHLWRSLKVNIHTGIDYDYLYGLHGYAQTDQRERIKSLKQSRNQEYDWDLLDRIEVSQ